jgi:hypothetical protein
MPIGKSRRIVIDVENVELKRSLYAALAAEGRSLKDWFEATVGEYLSVTPATRNLARSRVSERRSSPQYGPSRQKRNRD